MSARTARARRSRGGLRDPHGYLLRPNDAGSTTSEVALPGLRLWADVGDDRVPAPAPDRELPVWRGRARPHLGGAGEISSVAGWWWLGVHGGAGTSTLSAWVPGGADAHRRWPDPACGGPAVVILLCRTHVAGLDRARDAARQWAARRVPDGLLLAGAIAVADAPGRMSRPQAEALRLLSGVVPRVWTVPWMEELRAAGEPGSLGVPPAVAGIAAELEVLRGVTAAGGPHGAAEPPDGTPASVEATR